MRFSSQLSRFIDKNFCKSQNRSAFVLVKDSESQ